MMAHTIFLLAIKVKLIILLAMRIPHQIILHLKVIIQKIKIYDVSFAPEVLDELLNLVVSKTDFDFSEYKLTKKG